MHLECGDPTFRGGVYHICRRVPFWVPTIVRHPYEKTRDPNLENYTHMLREERQSFGTENSTGWRLTFRMGGVGLGSSILAVCFAPGIGP